MSEKKKMRPVSELQVAKAQGAVLEAAGFNTEQIANMVNVSGASVKRWRRDEDYQQMKESALERHIDDLQPLLEQIKVAVAGAADKAVGVLVQAMDKKDDEGLPHRNAIDAARAALGQMKLVTGEGSGEERGNAQTAVIVVSSEPEKKEEPKRIDQPDDVSSTAIEIPDEEG